MHRAVLSPLLVALALALGPSANAQPPLSVSEAASRLSLYAPGHMPQEPAVVLALSTLKEHGTRRDVSLLRNLANNESASVADHARTAMHAIQQRQHRTSREALKRQLGATLPARIAALRSRGSSPKAAHCQGYAEAVLDASIDKLSSFGAARGLQAGRALEARGEVGQAVRAYSVSAASGDKGSQEALARLGIDTERLLLGLLDSRSEATIVDHVVSHGGELTQQLLTERAQRGTPQQQAVARRALHRMQQR